MEDISNAYECYVFQNLVEAKPMSSTKWSEDLYISKELFVYDGLQVSFCGNRYL